MTYVTQRCQRSPAPAQKVTTAEIRRTTMFPQSNKHYPPLAPEVFAELGKWPGAPSLAVVGEEGILGCHDTGKVYRIASVTKLLTSLTVLSAVEERVISLDDAAGPAGSSLRHLLSHASGVGFDDDQIRAKPGARRIYSNTGIDLAAAYLSARSGKSFEDEMRTRVLEPLDMYRTVLAGPPAKGGLAPITDLALLARELLRPRVFSDAIIEQMSSLTYAGLPGFLPGFGYHSENTWGIGAEIRGTKDPHWTSTHNSPATFGHFGMAGSFLWVDREAKLACTALSTVDFGEWALTVWPATSTAVLNSYRRPPGTPEGARPHSSDTSGRAT
jgi:CubicO group peptidase (beta-lactamase class C family)